jgi:hypothetical protein
MESWACWAHRRLWHQSTAGWALHHSHHSPRKGAFEVNDLYALVNGMPATALCAWGFHTPGLLGAGCFGAGLGITLYGMTYMFVHDGLIHRWVWLGSWGCCPAGESCLSCVVHGSQCDQCGDVWCVQTEAVTSHQPVQPSAAFTDCTAWHFLLAAAAWPKAGVDLPPATGSESTQQTGVGRHCPCPINSSSSRLRPCWCCCRRFPVGPLAGVPALQRIAAAHQVHHSGKLGGLP